MGLISWLVVGAIAGWVAGKIVKGSGYGLIGNVVVGIIGAVAGGWLAGTFLNMPNAINGLTLETIVVSIVGAIVVLWVFRLLSR